ESANIRVFGSERELPIVVGHHRRNRLRVPAQEQADTDAFEWLAGCAVDDGAEDWTLEFEDQTRFRSVQRNIDIGYGRCEYWHDRSSAEVIDSTGAVELRSEVAAWTGNPHSIVAGRNHAAVVASGGERRRAREQFRIHRIEETHLFVDCKVLVKKMRST